MADLVAFSVPIIAQDRDVQRSVEGLQSQMNRQGCLERPYTVQLADRVEYGRGIEFFQRSDTTTFESHAALGCANNAAALSTVAIAKDIIIAVPFVATDPYTKDILEFEVTTASGANGKGRVGIYLATDALNGTPYPGARVFQGDEFAVTSATVKSTSMNMTLTQGQLYFACYICGTAAPTVRAIPSTNMYQFLQYPATLGTSPQYAYTVASTYSSNGMPETYPSGATAVTTGAVPAIFVRSTGIVQQSRYFHLFSPSLPGYLLRRVKLLSPSSTTRSAGSNYVKIEPSVRTTQGSSVLATFDTRTSRIVGGTPYYLVGPTELDLNLDTDSQLEVKVTYFGFPTQSIRDIGVQADIAFTGAQT